MQRGRMFGLIGALAIAIVLALGIGLGVGLGMKKDDDNSSSAQAASTGQTSNNAAKDATNNGGDSKPSVEPLAKWDWTSSTTKMTGMALGNWLVLERWMDEDWFRGLAGDNAWDEWTFTQAVGANASTALEEHWNKFTSQDVDALAQAGFNHLRIPLGFWALIPTEGDEPYVTTGQLAQVDRVLEAAYKNKMHVLLDLHGMPGNQNGEQQSGHNTSSIQFYTPEQQTRSDQTLQALIDYMGNSTYSSIFSGIGLVNEPHPWTQQQLDTLTDFYERSYAKLSALGIPMIFHHAFQGADYWRPFLAGKDPSLIILEDHPYPGNFPLQDNAEDIIKQVCDKATSYTAYPVPVCVSEWSLTTGITDPEFEKRFFRAQSSAFAWSGGSTFWSYKTTPSDNPVLANPDTVRQYSYVDLMQSGALEAPSTWANSNTEEPCGPAPTVTWANPVPSQSTTVSSHFKRAKARRARSLH